MLGSDMALFTANRPNEIVDAHVVDQPVPTPDECQEDWILINSTITSGPVAQERQDQQDSEDFIMFEVRRKLNTEDPQDLPLINDKDIVIPEQRIIAAWGDTDEVGYHGANVARGSIRVFKQDIQGFDFDETMATESDGYFFIGAKDYEIPTNDTTYADFCFSRADLIAQGVPDSNETMSVIGFRPVVQEGESSSMVHHYVVTGFFNASEDVCTGEARGMDMVYGKASQFGHMVMVPARCCSSHKFFDLDVASTQCGPQVMAPSPCQTSSVEICLEMRDFKGST